MNDFFSFPARRGLGRSWWFLSILLVGALSSCIHFDPRDDSATGPEAPTDLTVAASANAPQVFEGNAVTLTATASLGRPPYRYRWDQNGGPTEVALTDVTAERLTTPVITGSGHYVFRVVVTDAAGFHATDYAVVDVAPAATASAPDYALVGEPAQLTASLEVEPEGVATLWEVAQGTATLDDPAALSPRLTTSMGETMVVRFTVTLPSTGETPVTTTREFEIVSVFDLHPRVRIETNFGDMVLELDGEAAPLHMVHFLLYVDEGFYDGVLFHRNACTENTETGECEPFVLQGGGVHRVDGELALKEPTREDVEAETPNGLSNGVPYSVALALVGGDPDSGNTQFFINLDEDNSLLDDQDFTVFGGIVEGRDVVDAIVAMERTDNPFGPPGELSLPVEDVMIERIVRVNISGGAP
jgi:peptidyl-prolyl cis-trans isomerase B (cyclophilin B)